MDISGSNERPTHRVSAAFSAGLFMRSSTEVARRLTVQTEKKLNDGTTRFRHSYAMQRTREARRFIEKSVADGECGPTATPRRVGRRERRWVLSRTSR